MLYAYKKLANARYKYVVHNVSKQEQVMKVDFMAEKFSNNVFQ